LEEVKERAEHAARLFKELAAQSVAQGQDLTNTYPTRRHVLAGLGKQARLMAEIQAKWGNVDEDKLPPAEQKAMQQAMIVVASEMVRLGQIARQLDDDEKEGPAQATASDSVADMASCFLYGALELDSGQFSSVNGLLEKYRQEAEQDHLMEAVPGESGEAGTNRVAALNQLNENVHAEIQTLLTPSQAATFTNSFLKDLKFVASGFNCNLGMPTGK